MKHVHAYSSAWHVMNTEILAIVTHFLEEISEARNFSSQYAEKINQTVLVSY